MGSNTSRGTRKIKICHVANTDRFVKFLLLSQLKFLVKEGYDVYVICPDGKWVSDIIKVGIQVKVVEMKRKISPLSDLIVLAKLLIYFKREKFQIVHVHNPKPGLLGQLAAKLAGVPIIINTIHGLYFHKDSSALKRVFFIFFEKVSALCSTLIFSQNKEDVNTLVKEKIAKPEKIRYLGNGVDIEKFNSKRFSEEFVRNKKRELNIPEGFIVVGIVARLVQEKGYKDLFKAFSLVLKNLPKTVLLVIGPEEMEKKDAIIPKDAFVGGVGKNIIFLGERADVEEIYPIMNIFVLPSYREGLPRAILEAMAEKIPVIASDIRGCREEIENNKSGILVPEKNPEKLAEAIMYLFNNSSKARDLGENARIRVGKYFDESLVFDRIKKEYERLTRVL